MYKRQPFAGMYKRPTTYSFHRRLYDGVFGVSVASGAPYALDYTNTPVTWASTAISSTPIDVGSPNNPIQWGFGCNFSFKDMIQQGEFAALFNEYNIKAVKLEISFNNGDSYLPASGAPQGSVVPTLIWSFDPNDSNPPADYETVAKWGNSKTLILNQEKGIQTVWINPKPAIALYGSVTGYAYVDRVKHWIDIGNTNVPHYGFKGWFRNFGNLNSQCQVRISPTVYFDVRHTR